MSSIAAPLSPVKFAVLFGAGLIVLTAEAGAQSPIGSATVVQNDVRGHTGGEIFRIARGDGVFLDELVQTSGNSKAKIVFLDTTNMSVGPDSIVKLDQFVYNGNGTAQTVSINATKGAFRFFSGGSDHRAYKVTTPQAVIGVRGTTYDVLIAGGQTFIKLQDGAVTACVRTGSTCRDLDQPGQYLIVNDASIEGPFPSTGNSWDFGSLCGGGAADLCRKTTRFAGNTPPPPPGGRMPPPPQNNFTPLPPGPELPRPTRVVGLPPVDVAPVYTPPVYVPPGRPGRRPPVVVYDPPGKPPQANPPRPPAVGKYPPGNPPRAPQAGKPTQGTPPILRGAGTRGNPANFNRAPRFAGQVYGRQMAGREFSASRSFGGQRIASPRMSRMTGGFGWR